MAVRPSRDGNEALAPRGRRAPDTTPTETRRSAPPQAIDLSIDEVVLHGFAAGDRYRIVFTLERELARLLAEQPMSDRLAAASPRREKVDGGSFEMPAGGSPELIGQRIALAIFRSLRDG